MFWWIALAAVGLVAGMEDALRQRLYREICADLIDRHMHGIQGDDFSHAIAGVQGDLEEHVYQGMLRSVRIVGIGYRDSRHFAFDLELDGRLVQNSPRFVERYPKGW